MKNRIISEMQVRQENAKESTFLLQPVEKRNNNEHIIMNEQKMIYFYM